MEDTKEKKRLYYEANKERILAKSKENYEKNKVRKAISVKKWNEANKEKLKEYHIQYRKNNEDKIKNYPKSDRKEYYEKNKIDLLAKNKIYREANKEKIKLRGKIYYEKNHKEMSRKNSEYIKKRRLTDPLFRLSLNTRALIRNSFNVKNQIKNNKTTNILGCTIIDFKTYLESLFEDWMSWDNYGLYNGTPNFGWDIDHIQPLSSGKCLDDIYQLNNFKNLQPLCSHINRNIKKDKYEL